MAPKKKKKKGTFGPARFPVAAAYIKPASRWRIMRYGLVAILVIAGFACFDFFGKEGILLSGGPLSSSHAGFGNECETCHEHFESVPSEKCSDCHEVFGDEPPIFSFTSHYLYRSDDFNRDIPSPDEMGCAGCHVEHMGRNVPLASVPDSRCITCHPYGSFNSQHPEFAFVTEQNRTEPEPLHFPHIKHVAELMKEYGLDEPEEACLACHIPSEGGKGFAALDFDVQCDSCHLKATTATKRLDIADGENVGVETLETIRARGGPDSHWALFSNPGEYTKKGRVVSKKPLHHKDPWVLTNLRRLRGMLYENAGLADLLRTSADVAPTEVRVLYAEAIQTLEAYALGLRGRPEAGIQAELTRITTILDALQDRVLDPYEPLDEASFALDLIPRSDLTEERREEIELLVNDLTEACQNCHVIKQSTILRVRKDQRQLTGAEFDHGAHILQMSCLDCHNAIPISAGLADKDAITAEQDNAAIVNLPSRERCIECHKPSGASNRCITCHDFHPEKNHRPRLATIKTEPQP